MVDDLLDFVDSKTSIENCLPIVESQQIFSDKSCSLSPRFDCTLLSPKEEAYSDSSDTPFDPNDFFNENFKSEVSYSPFSSPSNRNTPSPSSSNGNASDSSATNDSLSTTILPFNRNDAVWSHQQQFIETPPISPPSDFAQSVAAVLPSTTSISQAIPVLNQVVTPASNVPNNINIIQGTLIPIKLSPPRSSSVLTQPPIINSQAKKIKIQPKPMMATSICATSSNIQKPAKPKTIVLSANDYKALMAKCKNPLTPNGESTKITIKTTTSNATTQPANFNKVPLISADIKPITFNTNERLPLPPMAKPIAAKLPKAEVDDRVVKKQMRMIKNRESACMSRKKKKEYVTSLENRISDLSKENQQLKSVSRSFSADTFIFSSKFSSFYLQENSMLKNRLNDMANRLCEICGAGKKQFSSSSSTTTFANIPKRNTAFLLAVIFMVSINVGPFLSTRSTIGSESDSSLSVSAPQSFHSRGLLWVDDALDSNSSSTSGDEQSAYPMCPVTTAYVNQTESVRLAGELKRWIGELPEYFNISKVMNRPNAGAINLNEFSDYLMTDAGNRAMKSLYKQMKNVRNYIRNDKQKVANEDKAKLAPKVTAGEINVATSSVSSRINEENRVQVYNADYSSAMKYAQFFEEIHRQDDTFYVVSFSGDHLLLPAVAHNKTFRPKMSLMLPAVGHVHNNGTFNTSGMFTLMQIDCEVVNTSMLQIKESSIPSHLWPPKKEKNVRPKRPTVKTNFQRNADYSYLQRNGVDKNITGKDNIRPSVHVGVPIAAAATPTTVDAIKPYFLYKNSERAKILNENSDDLI